MQPCSACRLELTGGLSVMVDNKPGAGGTLATRDERAELVVEHILVKGSVPQGCGTPDWLRPL
jgi:hypothetical protein